ncbi:PAC2 family protein [Agromyces sp. MMS17-SY077]|uniref:PAC2 family protein n=1 Tax=Agromyces seonyuensis TaxID=2662446 RepID=A0A6I4NTY9_9MICO|nr:PAC2 family protein [Agromyces seonyuensis]MWB97848.1 PAC2 family protein [Agromyces seonyuensis]
MLIVAFEGWNDAGDAATGALRAIRRSLDLVEIAAVDPELYFDYQFTRPTVTTAPDGTRSLEWPGAVLYGPTGATPEPGEPQLTGPGADAAHLLVGQEPARTWKGFAAELVDAALAADVDGVLFLGAMLADAPHTRPLTVFASSENPEVRSSFGLERSEYEGPVGILSVLAAAAEQAGLPTLTLWASVPHYVHQSPSPKAVLALLSKIEELTGWSIPRGDLEREAEDWVANVDALAEEDEDMAAYIEQLERHRDAVDSPEASGDAIAEEFEQYLRRRGDGPVEPWQRPGS